jgi:hypothetical protein
MARFLFVYRNSPENYQRIPTDQRQEYTQKWAAWIGEGMQKGWILDPGDALTEEGRVVNATLVTDGPFVESKEVVGGFSIVEADTFDAASRLAGGCPGLQLGGTVEVRRLAGYTMKP